MYRELINRTKASRASSHLDHRRSSATSYDSQKVYEEGNNSIRQYFNDIQQIISFEQDQTASPPDSDQKLSNQQRMFGKFQLSAAVLNQSNRTKATTATVSPIPEKMLQPLVGKDDIMAIQASSPSSKQHVSKIERASKKQIESIQKLQDRLTRTQQINVSQGHKYSHETSYNDYISTSVGQDANTSKAKLAAQTASNFRPRGSSQQMKLINNREKYNQTAVSSGNYSNFDLSNNGAREGSKILNQPSYAKSSASVSAQDLQSSCSKFQIHTTRAIEETKNDRKISKTPLIMNNIQIPKKSQNYLNTTKKNLLAPGQPPLGNYLDKIGTKKVSYLKNNNITLLSQQRSKAADSSPRRRTQVAQIIGRLDLEDTIRSKARNYFMKYQDNNMEKNYDDLSQVNISEVNIQQQQQQKNHISLFLATQDVNEINLQRNDCYEDQKLLESTYSERQVATQHEIKRKLNQIITQQQIIDNRNQVNQFSSNHDSVVDGSMQSCSNDDIRTSLDDEIKIMDKESHNKSVPQVDTEHYNYINKTDQIELDGKHKQLLEISHKFSKMKKEKMSKTVYNPLPRKKHRNKLTDIQMRDYCVKILGEYRFELRQKAPRSTDPNAPEAYRFSQLPQYRFAETNKRYMELFNDQMQELRQTRTFLAEKISKTPEGLNHANQIKANQPFMSKLTDSVKLELIDQTIKEQLEQVKKKQEDLKIGGLIELQKRKKLEISYLDDSIKKKISDLTNQRKHDLEKLKKLKFRKKTELQLIDDTILERLATVDNTQSDYITPLKYEKKASSATKQSSQLLSQIKRQTIDNYTMESIDLMADQKLDESVQNIIKGKPMTDSDQDLVEMKGTRGQDLMHRLKKCTYEMDQMLTDDYYGQDQSKMGLSMCYRQQVTEQKDHFQTQKAQVMNYLEILFGGDTSSKQYQDMSKNLIRKLSRQKTDDSMTRERARQIEDEEMASVEIDNGSVNTEIVTMLADEILRKTEFFKMFKSNIRGQDDLIQQSQGYRLDKIMTNLPIEQLQNNKADFFHRVQQTMMKDQQQTSQSAKKFDSQKGFTKLDSCIVDEHLLQKQNIYQRIAKQRSQTTPFEMQTLEDVHNEQAKASFIQQCEKNLVVTLPLLLRVKDKKIFLQRYQLNNGLCKALAIALAQFPDIATEFYFESNNMTDDDFAELLLGMNELTFVSCLTYKQQTFGQKSLEALIPIIRRKQTHLALRSLHIVHCKITAKVTNELLFSLNQQKNRIRSLSLVNVNLNQSNYLELCDLIKVSRSLQDLDISWNSMRCQQMFELIDVIAENRSLQFLDLSYNNLQNPLQAKFAESTPQQILQTIAQRKVLEDKQKYARTQAQKAKAEYEAMDISMQHILKLCKFIKMNNKLMHLNLSGMGMTEQMMNQFGRALRRTKSMVSLHLSYNNGDTASLREALIERAHMKPFEPIVRPDFRSIYSPKNHLVAKEGFKLENSIIIGDQADKQNQGKSKISDQLNLKNMLKNKKGEQDRKDSANEANEMLIFTRYLGHKIEIPGSGQWRMISTSHDEHDRCWVCNGEIYTLIFWSREFGFLKQQELDQQGFDSMAYENTIYDLEYFNRKRGTTADYYVDPGNPQLLKDGHKIAGFPQISGEFNNWRPQRMYTLEEFCYILDSSKPNIIENLKRGNYISDMVQKVEDMNPKERQIYEDKMKSLLSKYSRLTNWRKILGNNLRYKKPYLANAEALLISNNSVKISKMEEGLYPSDSQSDLGSESDSSDSAPLEKDDEKSIASQAHNSILASTELSSPLQKNRKKVQRSRMSKQLYVFPCFIKPGRQNFIVQSLVWESDFSSQSGQKGHSFRMRNNQSPFKSVHSLSSEDLYEQYFYHQVQAPMRRERVPLFVKKLKKKTNDTKIDMSKTIFKEWKPPTEKDFDNMLEHDIKHWKIPRFIKDPSMLKQVYKLFRSHMRKLFYTFITVSAGSNFPGITMLGYAKFTQQCQVPDENLEQQHIDRQFLASIGKSQMFNYRYQFLEACMRVADIKYFQSGQAATQAQALSMLIEDNLLQHGPVNEWQEFRDKFWWSIDNHKILLSNLKELKKVYHSFFSPRKKYMNKSDCIDLMTKTLKLIPDENKVIYCYGMSKMALVQDTIDKGKYDQMLFTEFLEFIGRCACIKYKEVTDMTMEDRLLSFMDELFPHYGVTRKEVEENEEELSESDPDY